MAKQAFISLPVSDLERFTTLCEALGFRKNSRFSDDNTGSLVWSDAITLMLLKYV